MLVLPCMASRCRLHTDENSRRTIASGSSAKPARLAPAPSPTYSRQDARACTQAGSLSNNPIVSSRFCAAATDAEPPCGRKIAEASSCRRRAGSTASASRADGTSDARSASLGVYKARARSTI
ncbi:hypothetical protein D3C71_1314850 [compost metagenome]